MATESSRIFIRGLPPKFNEDDVRKHFARFPVTDVKFFPHRRIGYVGYKTPEDATKAVKYFNKTFINLTRIYAEIARPYSDKDIPKSRRAQRSGQTTAQEVEAPRALTSQPLKRKRDQVDEDPKLKEFLDAYQPPSKTQLWKDADAQMTQPEISVTEIVPEIVASEDESDDEYQMIAKKPKTVLDDSPIAIIVKEDKDEHNALESIPRDKIDVKIAESGADPPGATDGPVSDADWLRTKTNRILDFIEDDEESRNIPETQTTLSSKPQSQRDESRRSPPAESKKSPPAVVCKTATVDTGPSEEEKIQETGRLYLRNLHFEVTEDELREFFSKHGPLEEVHVSLKKSDGKGKGFAFVQFQNPDHAIVAFREHDSTIFQGRLLHIISAKAKKDTKLDEFEIAKLPLKKQKEIRRKQEAGKATFNWNSLYLNTDAVMSTIANRMGISKAELLDPTSSDAAIKQAHAETHIIQETKTYFAKHGVDLEAFQRSAKGDTAVLVKNIPHGVAASELRTLFEEHGTVTKFLMPPTGMTAIIEFSNAVEARSAFASLSYRKMKDSILFLEKAPKELFKAEVAAASVKSDAAVDESGLKPSVAELLEAESTLDAGNVATLYVRNLNFTTTTERLAETFKPLPGFRSAKVKTKVHPKRGLLSMGFGFVEFDNPESASSALRTMSGFDLEGHQLQIRASHKGADAAEERRKEDAAKKATSSKIIIKNLPFEATKKDVRALFTPYGQLRSVRVPKKFDASSRGFGFAEFATKRDAVNAMNALKNTHFLGRRLVLAFAETEPDDPEAELEKMQQKVGAQANKVALQRLTAGGRKKFDMAGTTDGLDD